MKLLVYTDLHSDISGEMSYTQPGHYLQIQRVRKFYAWLLTIYKAHKCSGLVDLGDTFGDRNALHYLAIDAVLEGLSQFPESDHHLKLIGNHEQHVRDTSMHVGRVFSSKFNVIDATDVIQIEDTLVACVAYPATGASLNDWLINTAYAYRNYQHRLLLGHFQVSGCQLNSGMAVTGVSVEAIDKFSLTLLGHIHKPQKIGRNGYYVGSPFQQNFGERGEVKRVGVLDTATLKMEWVTVPGFPEYRVVDFTEWAKVVNKSEEHRYQVILRDPKQSEAFYKHPLMACAEPIYNYELDKKEETVLIQQQAWTRTGVMERWLAQVPPSSRDISLAASDVLEVGNAIAEHK